MTAETDPRLEDRPVKVLLVCTRDPRGRMSGRKMVLRTIIESLVALGNQVTIAYFGEPEVHGAGPDTDQNTYVALPHPSLFDRLPGALRWLFVGSVSLNEALYHSRRAEAALIHLVHTSKADVVITDMLRTAQYGARLGLPWVADLDDLLSRRYANLAEGYTAQSNLLGYYQSRFGQVVLKFGARLMPSVLRREAAAAQRREIEVARLANVTTLVSTTEAAALTKASGCKVWNAPMAVPGPAELPALTGRSEGLVFVGGLDYGPNLKSVLQFDKLIYPALANVGQADLSLHVIGHTAGKSGQFSDAVILDGYVDDLDAAVQSYRAMLVPEVVPGGVKTKIIVGALNGTIVVAHRTALYGMGLQHGVDVLAWETSAELAEQLRLLRQGAYDLDAMARAARMWAQNHYSPEVLTQTWRQILGTAMSQA